MSPFRIPSSILRLALLGGMALAVPAGRPVLAQAPPESVSALPAPVTRGQYRTSWFVFLNALHEDDDASAAKALEEMKKAGRAVGVRRLSDFSRTAVFEGRRAEADGKFARALRAFDAALQLDDGNADARAARAGYLMRRGDYFAALREVAESIGMAFATREGRLAVISSAALWLAVAFGLSLTGFIFALGLRRLPQARHDLKEYARRSRFGERAVVPLAVAAALLPLALGFGPVWIVLFWAVLVMPYAVGPERIALIIGLLLVGLASPMLQYVARENILRRSPLYVAAIDLEERREDGSAEDGLRQASSVFAEDSDVWFLLGLYSERSGDLEKAAASYTRAIRADPKDYRNFLHRGNVRFQEGDFPAAIRDYEAAVVLAPRAAEAYYNLSLAKGEAYDFPGQAAAMASARALAPATVNEWSTNPTTLQRTVSAPYTVSQARRRVERWNSQPKSRRLPGHTPTLPIWKALLSPFTLLPFGLVALGVAWARRRDARGTAQECNRCGAAFCGYCKPRGESPLYCEQCVRLHLRKETVPIEEHVRQNREIRARVARRDGACRIASVAFPGTHRIFESQLARGGVTMLFFFFLLAAASLSFRIFNPWPLAAEPVHLAMMGVSGLVAVGIWLAANWSAWRQSHGA